MKTRRLGKTELQVSEIGFGGEWLERHPEEESIELIHYASSKGINILDCWMPDPKSRNIIGEGIKENRDKWFIQGHIGSTWKDEQYYRTREMEYVRPAFEDLLKRLQTDYIDLGMIHYRISFTVMTGRQDLFRFTFMILSSRMNSSVESRLL